jgi:hypothetical protein
MELLIALLIMVEFYPLECHTNTCIKISSYL